MIYAHAGSSMKTFKREMNFSAFCNKAGKYSLDGMSIVGIVGSYFKGC